MNKNVKQVWFEPTQNNLNSSPQECNKTKQKTKGWEIQWFETRFTKIQENCDD